MNLQDYQKFVTAVTSKESKDLTTFMNRLDEVDGNYLDKTQGHGPDVNVPLLITAALGLSAEAGEFVELPKKIFFQGKPLTEDVLFHMKRELGDVIFYWMNACTALDLDPQAVIDENFNKLKSRYPDGEFKAEHSENRKAGDL